MSIVLRFLWISKEKLSFDPTIMTANDKRFIEIEQDSLTERLIIDEIIQHVRYIASQATTCWKAYYEGYLQTPLVIKDS
jgi:hypothetical protein